MRLSRYLESWHGTTATNKLLAVAVVAGMWECAALMRSRVSGGTAHR